ncbi:hypothetical protein GCM10027589_18730 [Actinocorallia lasiicapitis]
MRRSVARFGALVAGAASAALAAALLMPDKEVIAKFVQEAGLFGPVIAVTGCALLTLALVPRTALAFLGGLLFGLGPGSAYVLVGALLGASASFAAGRLLGREFLMERLKGSGRLTRRLAKLDGWLGRHGVLGVIFVRLLPIAPYGLTSYAFGTSATGFRPYLVGSAIGAVPTTVGYAALGAAVWGPDAMPMAIGVLSAIGLMSLAVTVLLRRTTMLRSPETAETG